MKSQAAIKKHLLTMQSQEMADVSAKTGFSPAQLIQYAKSEAQWPLAKVQRFNAAFKVARYRTKYILQNTKKGTSVDVWEIEKLKKHAPLSLKQLNAGFIYNREITGWKFIKQQYPVFEVER